MSDSSTPFSSQCEILADLWINYRLDEGFADFMEYNDIGLPLSYAVANNLAKVNSLGEKLVSETFDVLLSGLGIQDTGFDNLDDLLDSGMLGSEFYATNDEDE